MLPILAGAWQKKRCLMFSSRFHMRDEQNGGWVDSNSNIQNVVFKTVAYPSVLAWKTEDALNVDARMKR
jgi:hypothetical protein